MQTIKYNGLHNGVYNRVNNGKYNGIDERVGVNYKFL